MSLDYDSWLSCQVDKEMETSDDYTESRDACGIPCTVYIENGLAVKVDVDGDSDTLTNMLDFSESFRNLFAKELGISSVDDVFMNIGVES